MRRSSCSIKCRIGCGCGISDSIVILHARILLVLNSCPWCKQSQVNHIIILKIAPRNTYNIRILNFRLLIHKLKIIGDGKHVKLRWHLQSLFIIGNCHLCGQLPLGKPNFCLQKQVKWPKLHGNSKCSRSLNLELIEKIRLKGLLRRWYFLRLKSSLTMCVGKWINE